MTKQEYINFIGKRYKDCTLTEYNTGISFSFRKIDKGIEHGRSGYYYIFSLPDFYFRYSGKLYGEQLLYPPYRHGDSNNWDSEVSEK